MSIPPAHRRLVPRRPRPSAEPEDLDVTQKRVVPAAPPAPGPGDSIDQTSEETIDQAADEPEDLDPTGQRLMPEPAGGTSLVDLELTTLRAQPSKSGIEDRPTAHLPPAEYGLLAAIAEGHEPSRLRYADWLERRGEPVRAELLRLDHALHAMSAGDLRFIPTLQRIRALAARVGVDWRSRVSRAAIEGCSAYGVTCPTYWRALPADADDVRTCAACGDKVYYCVTLPLAQDRVNKGQRVALDVACERWPHDLDRQCDGCSGQVSPQSRFCPHCGRAMPRARSLG